MPMWSIRTVFAASVLMDLALKTESIRTWTGFPSSIRTRFRAICLIPR